jgi:hypothetical protein
MLEDDTGNGEQALMGKSLFIHHLIAWRRPASRHTHLLQHPNGVTWDLVIIW